MDGAARRVEVQDRRGVVACVLGKVVKLGEKSRRKYSAELRLHQYQNDLKLLFLKNLYFDKKLFFHFFFYFNFVISFVSERCPGLHFIHMRSCALTLLVVKSRPY